MNESISWLMRHREHLPINSAMLDVGAYHGEFTEKALQAGIFSKAWLFEPNHENLKILKRILFKKPTTIIDVAVSDFVGRGSFHYDKNFATGSLLPYCESGGRKCDGKIETTQVPQITLDHFYEELPTDQKISLIKIDTQGMDLRVIKGATRLIETQRPWLLVEMIFVPLYDGQSDPREIWDWCGSHDYILGGFFDDHYSFDGWLSYADAMFVPREIANHFQLPFSLRRNPTQEAEIDALKQVCDERLKLIEYLHHEAEKRLVIIKDMEQQLHLQAN